MTMLSKNSIKHAKYLSELKIKNCRKVSGYNNICKKIYSELKNSHEIVNNNVTFKKNELLLEKINYFPDDSMPQEIKDFIFNYCTYKLSYSKTIKSVHKINVSFYLTDNDINNIHQYKEYIKLIFLWFIFAVPYSTTKCSKIINVNLYLTDYLKTLPASSINILSPININTGYTRRCSRDSNIVIYRKEEWFKVLIHESMHYLALDIDIGYKYNLYDIFKLTYEQTSMKIDEAYAEIWARMINIYILSYKSTSDFVSFKSVSDKYFNLERVYSCYQACKVLKFIGLNYYDLVNTNDQISMLKRNLYKENTNVFSYYILTCILMDNPYKFIIWCYNNNTNMIKLAPLINIELFLEYFRSNYMSKTLLENLNRVEELFNKDYDFDRSLKMTVIEIN